MKKFNVVLLILILSLVATIGCVKTKGNDSSDSSFEQTASFYESDGKSESGRNSIATNPGSDSSINTSNKSINSSKVSSKPDSTVKSPAISSSLTISDASSVSEVDEDSMLFSKRKNTVFYNDKSIKVLILGNSFVNSSEIGRALSNVAAVNNCEIEVTSISQGYYDATKYYNDLINTTFGMNSNPGISSKPGGSHYVEENIYITYKKKLLEGNYDVVFLCGMYAYSDMQSVIKINDLLKETKTKLVIFPADNENKYYITAILDNNPTIGLANWNFVIDILKIEEFPGFSLYYDDMHKHTNEFGGYVGACVIFNYLYNKSPQDSSTNNTVFQQFKDALPGNSDSEKRAKIKIIEDTARDNWFIYMN